MKIYIASSFDNIPQVVRLAQRLEAAGHRITYKWWPRGPAFNPALEDAENLETLTAVAEDEINGVVEADATVVLMPGGKGTHTELGAALVTAAYLADDFRRVFVCGPADPFREVPPRVTCFWYHPRVERHWQPDEAVLFDDLVRRLGEAQGQLDLDLAGSP